MDYYRQPPTTLPVALVRDSCLLILRLTAGGVLLMFHWREALAAWQFVWHKQPWDYLESIRASAFPLPEAVACGSTVLGLLCAVFIVTGMLTRISALVLLALTAVTFFLYMWVPVVAEVTMLYGGLLLVLFISGPGTLSCDALLRDRRTVRRR